MLSGIETTPGSWWLRLCWRCRPAGRSPTRSSQRCAYMGCWPSADPQRQAVHRPTHQGPPGGGAVRAGVPGERHHRQTDPPLLTDRDRKDRTWHRTLRRELLDVTGPFADLPSKGGGHRLGARLQPRTAAPALDMATPASLFRPNINAGPNPAVVVPQPSKRRPLSIPVIVDRVLQSLGGQRAGAAVGGPVRTPIVWVPARTRLSRRDRGHLLDADGPSPKRQWILVLQQEIRSERQDGYLEVP